MKRYQVFISSTYADLKEERQRVMQSIMEMDCIPAGMELFPALDEAQLDFIKSVIDESDYYVLIIGGRYGSISREGISYTEAEYDYAVSKDIKVIALIHGEPEGIPQGKTDQSDQARIQLNAFRDKVMNGRLVRTWKRAEELPGLVALSLSKTIRAYPGRGWVRGDVVASTEILAQVNELRQENQRLKDELDEHNKAKKSAQDLASGKEIVSIYGIYKYKEYTSTWSKDTTWDSLFSLIGPKMIIPLNQSTASSEIGNRINQKDHGYYTDERQVETIGLQFSSLGLIRIYVATTVGKAHGIFWQLTQKGIDYLAELRAVRSAKAESSND